MFSWILMVIVAAVVAIGQTLLIRSAWRFRHPSAELPPGVPRSNPHGDLAWTLATALGTTLVLVFAIQSIR